MNLNLLIERHPLLHADLRNLGLSYLHVLAVGRRISAQLGGMNGNLSQVLEGMDRAGFVAAIDVKDIAADAGITPALAQASVFTIAPWVERFRPNNQ